MDKIWHNLLCSHSTTTKGISGLVFHDNIQHAFPFTNSGADIKRNHGLRKQIFLMNQKYSGIEAGSP